MQNCAFSELKDTCFHIRNVSFLSIVVSLPLSFFLTDVFSFSFVASGIQISATSSRGRKPTGRRIPLPKRNTWRWTPTALKSVTGREWDSALSGRSICRNCSPPPVSNLTNFPTFRYSRRYIPNLFSPFRSVSSFVRPSIALGLSPVTPVEWKIRFINLKLRSFDTVVESKSIGSITFSGRRISIVSASVLPNLANASRFRLNFRDVRFTFLRKFSVRRKLFRNENNHAFLSLFLRTL